MKKNHQLLRSKTGLGLSLLMLVLSISMKAQLSGVKSIPTDYATLALAVADINLQGVNGSLTVNIPAGYTETAPVGGYVLTATGTLANPIIFQKNGVGANPLLTAYTGTATPGSASQDGVFRLVGSDYVTIDGIDITDPNVANPATMEFGYALYKASLLDGAQNNTIKNCVITLNRINNAAGTSPMVDGSTGIIVMNATSAAATTVLVPTTAAGTNSNNKIYSNTIQNCNIGIGVIGYAATTPFLAADFGNDVGGFSPLTGNTILNYGGGAATSAAAGIRTLAQYNLNVSFNTINNNNGSGVNHATTLRGIFINTATSANVAITNNMVTVKSGATTSALTAIDNASGSTAASNTVAIINNMVTNCSYTTATTGIFTGINNSGSAANVFINNNAISNLIYAGTGTGVLIETGSPTNATANSNTITAITRTGASGSFRLIKTSSPSTFIANNNLIDGVSWTNLTSTGSVDGIYSLSSALVLTANNNIIRNISIPTTGTINGIREFGSSANKVFQNNEIYNFTTTAGGVGGSTFNGIFCSTGNIDVNSNLIHDLTSTGTTGGTTGAVNGIQIAGGTTNSISKNKIYNLNTNSTGGVVSGILISGGTTNTLLNNLVGSLTAPFANLSNAVIGLNNTSGTNTNIYNNTVLLNATSSGATFGTSALSANTVVNLDLRNNILVNNSTFSGTGISAAYRRSTTTLTTYAATSNNNLFYAGTPSANNAILTEGINTYSTLATYKTAMATRDQAAISENPTFLSTTGSASSFLHIDPSVVTAIESGATTVSSFSTDIDGDIRFGNAGYVGTGSSYDMGADEFNGTSPAPVIDAIAITPTGNQCTAVSRNVTATVTPGATPITTVVLNYSFNGVAQTPITMTGGTFTAQSIWSATIPTGIPTNANVTWNVSTTDGTYSKVKNGASYKDESLLGVSAQAVAILNPICAGSSTTLTPSFANPIAASNYALPPAVSNPLTDEDIGNVTFGDLNNTSVRNSLVGTLGTASGVVGSFSDYTALGTFSFVAGNSYTLSVGSLSATTAYSNAIAVYIDYNRNGSFSDVGESVLSGGLILGSHTESMVVTIPATAKNGLTRMRVINDEALITSPTQVVGYGEYEEYMLNISSANQGGGSVSTFTAYAWNDGTSTVATTSTAVLSPITNTTYSITATDANGCTVTSTPVTVTVNPLPSAPLAHSASQCGIGVSVASVSGGTSYIWYGTPTSTVALQSGTSATFTTAIGTTTTFYVSSDDGCLSPRTAVTTTVNIPESVMASASATMICPNTAVMLASTQGSVAVYNFTWTATPTTGSGMSSFVVSQTATVTPTLAGTYVYQVFASDGICSTTSTVSVTLNDVPSITAMASPTMVCSGADVSLDATTPVIASGTGTLGTGSTTSSSGGSPFYHGWGGAKVQYIYTAAELVAQGFSAGNITAMALNVTAVGIPYEGFAINAGTTSQSSFTSANTINGLTQVFLGSGTNNSYLPTVGVNTFSFSSPINWNGTDNLVISICWSNATTGGASSTVQWNTYSSNVGMYIYSDSQTPSTVCNATTTIPASGGSSTTLGRPQTIFTGQIQTQAAGALVWQWNPGAVNSNTALVNPVNTGTAAATMIYTVSGTNTLTTCSNTATVSVLVNPLPSTPLASNSIQCGLGVSSASVSGGTSYNWYATATSTTVLQAGSATNYTTAIGATTSWYVASFNGTCESPRVMLTQTVTIPDAVTAVSSASAICPGGSYTLVAVKTGTMNNYAYTWNASPSVGSGMTTTVTGASQVVMPTTVGNYNYVVTAVDGVCTTTASVMVMLNDVPVITTAMATPTAVCSNETFSLQAISLGLGSQSLASYTCVPTSSGGSCISLVSLNTLNRVSACETGNYLDVPTTAATTSLTIGKTYSLTLNTNASAISSVWFDWNRNGLYEASEWIQPFTTGTVGIVPVTIPGTASTGITKMRVRTRATGNTNGATDACSSFGSGEAEDYTINILADLASNYNWTWNPGTLNGSAVSTSLSNTTTAAMTQGYTVTATNTITGCSNTATTSVVINPLPTMPLATNAMQCGLAVPTASVSGGTSYNWYAAATSTTALQMGVASNFTTAIGATTTWYVASFNGNCEGPRVAVTQSVTIPDAITAVSTASAICPNGSFVLSAINSGTTNAYNYTWIATPTLGSGMPTSVTGATTAVNPTADGTYNYAVTGVDGVCTTTAAVSVIVNPSPSIVASASPTAICSGDMVNLNAIVGNLGTVAIGTETTTTSTTGITPYSSFYEGAREQYIITAAELLAANLAPGNITSLAFNVTALGAGTQAQNNFAIKLAHTSDVSLSSAYGTPNGVFATVYGPVTQALPTLGANVYTFGTPFNWDGVSNILVDICHDNDVNATCSGCYSSNSSVSTSTTSYNSVWGSYADNVQSCGVQAGSTIFTYNNRPNMVFGGVVGQSGPYAFQWNPGAINSNTASVNPVNTGTSSATTIYTVSVTNTLTGCSNTANASVVVNPYPVVAATSASSVICANYTTTLTATGATSYTWMPAGGNVANAIVMPSATTVYTVVGTTAGCSGTATVEITTNPSPTITVASSATSAVCPATSVTLATIGVATTYTWNPAVSTSSMAVVTPTANMTYTVMAEDLGCITTKTIAIAVNGTTLNVAASNTAICLGTTSGVTILASGSAVSYTWSPAVTTSSLVVVTPTITTNYSITGANALGCETTKTITINVANTPTVTITSSSPSVCAGNSATLTANGATNYTWSPITNTTSVAVVTPTGTSMYTVYGEVNGCSSTGTVTVVTNALPVVNASATPTLICKGESATLSATTTATSYTWSNGANTISTVVTPSVTSGYMLTVSDGNCKSSTTVSVSVSDCIGIEELSLNGVSLYPNPTTEILNIDINSNLVDVATVNVYDALGKLVISQNLTSEKTIIRTSNLDTGMYFVKIISNNVEVRVQKLIKQ